MRRSGVKLADRPPAVIQVREAGTRCCRRLARHFWRLAGRLFSRLRQDPIDPTALHAACRSPIKSRASDQARHFEYFAPQLRDTSLRERKPHPDHSSLGPSLATIYRRRRVPRQSHAVPAEPVRSSVPWATPTG